MLHFLVLKRWKAKKNKRKCCKIKGNSTPPIPQPAAKKPRSVLTSRIHEWMEKGLFGDSAAPAGAAHRHRGAGGGQSGSGHRSAQRAVHGETGGWKEFVGERSKAKLRGKMASPALPFGGEDILQRLRVVAPAGFCPSARLG